MPISAKPRFPHGRDAVIEVMLWRARGFPFLASVRYGAMRSVIRRTCVVAYCYAMLARDGSYAAKEQTPRAI